VPQLGPKSLNTELTSFSRELVGLFSGTIMSARRTGAAEGSLSRKISVLLSQGSCRTIVMGNYLQKLKTKGEETGAGK